MINLSKRVLHMLIEPRNCPKNLIICEPNNSPIRELSISHSRFNPHLTHEDLIIRTIGRDIQKTLKLGLNGGVIFLGVSFKL